MDDVEILKEIGKGNWSTVKLGKITGTSQVVAVKEEIGSRSEVLILHEAKIMKRLQGVEGIPILFKHASIGDSHYIVMQRLHCTLQQLHKQGLLKLEEVLRRSKQLLATMNQMHDLGVVHQDLKPSNLMTSDDYLTSYYIDFGLSKFIRKRQQLPRRMGIVGTLNFASMSALLGVEQNRKDDLESLGYVIVWLITGRLPWESLALEGNIAALKTTRLDMSVSDVCRGCPIELEHYFNYVQSLSFTGKPDYTFLINLFESAMSKMKQDDRIFIRISSQEDLTNRTNGLGRKYGKKKRESSENHLLDKQRKVATKIDGSDKTNKEALSPYLEVETCKSHRMSSYREELIEERKTFDEEGEKSLVAIQRKRPASIEPSELQSKFKRSSTRRRTVKQSLTNIGFRHYDSRKSTAASPLLDDSPKPQIFRFETKMIDPPKMSPEARSRIVTIIPDTEGEKSSCISF